MNLVGKIFVVLIFVLSLVQMSLTMTVYVTHTNWRLLVDNTDLRLGPLGLNQVNAALEEENRGLKARYATVEDRLDKEHDNLRKELTKLQTEKASQEKELADLQKQVDKLQTAQRDNITKANTAQTQVSVLMEENIKIRDQIKSLVLQRDQEVNTTVTMTEQFNNATRKVQELEKRIMSLSSELNRATEVLTYLNLVPDVTFYQAQSPPTDIIAHVTEVNSDRRLVEISLGTDDGVRVGHRFEVRDASGASYLGQIVVTDAKSDRSVCSVQADLTNGVISKGNRAIPVKSEIRR